MKYTKKLQFIEHSRNKLIEIIFVSLLEKYTLSSFRNLLIKSIDSDLDSNIFYMVIMDDMKKMKIMMKKWSINIMIGNFVIFLYYMKNIIMLTYVKNYKDVKKEKFKNL